MKALVFVLLALLLSPTLLHAQGATPVGTASGRIQLMVLDASQRPVAGARASFVSEAQEVLATCTTDAAGRCTLLVADAPADASGFIRGAVVIEERGRKPLLWPGGEIEVELVLGEAGQLEIPHDLYPTRTPGSVGTLERGNVGTPAQPEVTATFDRTATSTKGATSTATRTALPEATVTGAPESSPTPTHVVLTSGRRAPDWMLLAGAGLLLLVALYVALGRRSQGGTS